MKTIHNKIFMLFCAIALLAANCDKIDSNNYLIYAGATGEWNDGNGVQDKTQRALIEKFTGVRCTNCPKADTVINAALASYNGQLIAVAIHDSNTAFCKPYDGQPDLRTDDGNTWSDYFGILGGALPKAMLNRTSDASGWHIISPQGGISTEVNEVLAEPLQVAIGAACTKNNGQLTIDVNLEFVENVDDALTLTLFLMEDGIVAMQALPFGKDTFYVHNHVLRDVITDVWGVDIDADGQAGTKRMARFVYTEANPEWVLDRCHIVAFVSNKNSRRILNVTECEID